MTTFADGDGVSLPLDRITRGHWAPHYFNFEKAIINTVFLGLRVPNTIEIDFYRSLQCSQFFAFCTLFFASIAGVCLQLHVVTLLGDIKGLRAS